ncbi:hypothetical protein [Alteromonas macleodii]|uniref:SMODS and SLOG-associating 2TM effector domain-containing protein n=1 Tax=Alteromonas macleodii TaxID=28108 RepID=A0AB36FTL7_ALTMA|nr:hypothetical protein [Alteromonas macleodii]OES30877.1 hypothetical protein BFV93_2261 [Alteromonas macleodii]OES31156.1 hypothetical protein BFV95_2268 [Alteromonas macleodii]OES31796.1 hypothetical protein BFV94_2266 [Alteromonas macleodii]OES40864.1 hypothetical protein BFV96_2255 [Alteromonas macleodii]
MYQQKYWNLLKELKVHVLYVQNYAVKQSKYDQSLDVFLAITSSSSIAAWAIWQEYPFVWGAIIAISQVITAIKPLLLYKKRLKALDDLLDSLSQIALKAERDWFFVAEGMWTEEEIHNRWADLKEETLKSEKKCLNGITLPKDLISLRAAETEADLYFESTYL